MTDLLVFILSICLLIRGAMLGFINSLIGPFSIIVTTFLSYAYYKNTQDMMASLIIGLAGPILLTLLLKYLLSSWSKAMGTIQPNALSRLLGAVLTFAWGWVFIAFTLLLLTVMPPWGPFLGAVHRDVQDSVSSSLIAKPLEKMFLGSSKQDVTAIVNAASSSDAKMLMQDPRFQAVLRDPQIQQEVQNRDIAKLMTDSKMTDLIQQLLDDPATMQKILNIYSQSAQGRAPAQTPKNP